LQLAPFTINSSSFCPVFKPAASIHPLMAVAESPMHLLRGTYQRNLGHERIQPRQECLCLVQAVFPDLELNQQPQQLQLHQQQKRPASLLWHHGAGKRRRLGWSGEQQGRQPLPPNLMPYCCDLTARGAAGGTAATAAGDTAAAAAAFPALFPIAFSQPTKDHHVPSFAGLLNSISPARQHQCRVISAPAASAICSPCIPSHEASVSTALAHTQQQVSRSGDTCVLNSVTGCRDSASSSVGSRCTQQEKQRKQEKQEMQGGEEIQERGVQGWVAMGDASAGLLDSQGQPAAGPENLSMPGCLFMHGKLSMPEDVPGNRSEASEESDDDELQDTAST
ncbi:hypothetical protein CLOM_g2741, partial [Closterium sp. NIES-68]